MQDDETTPPGDAEPAEGTRARDGEPDGGGSVSSIAERAARASGVTGDRERAEAAKGEDGRSLGDRADDAPDEGELFPLGVLDGDPAVTLKNLIGRGVKVEYTVSMRSAEVPMRGGLPNPNDHVRLAVTTEVAKVEEVAIRDSESGKVTGWKIRATLRPTYVEPLEAALADPAVSAPAAAAG